MDINQNLSNLMKEAQKMQKRMQEAQEELTKQVVEGIAGSGMVKAIMNCRHDLLDLFISERLVQDGDVEMLQDVIKAAINDAVKKVEKVSKEKIGQLTAGLNIPTDLLGETDDE